MKTIWTKTHTPYSICIENGILSNIPTLLKELKTQNLVVVTDDTVDKLYAQAICDALRKDNREVCKYVFPHGEGSKNMQTLYNVYQCFAKNNINRSDLIIAVGGGVVGDLAGFAAASWMRGIQFVQIPTTFLAMIDSSVGGKTAVDLPEGKNLIGAFWQPSMVICDPSTLQTLPELTLSDGIAEAIKTGAILDKELFEILERGELHSHMEEIIARCIDHKRIVVENDEHDWGIRQWLNFGHTLAHAIEKESGYTIPHGRAVAIGMIILTRACEKNGITPIGTADRIVACCEKYKLPTTINYNLETLCKHCLGDKKCNGNMLSLIVLEQLGKAKILPIKADSLLTFLNGEAI